jgi:hypothetical protein
MRVRKPGSQAQEDQRKETEQHGKPRLEKIEEPR